MRRWSSRRRRRRQSSWVPGLNFGEAANFATVTMATLGGISTTRAITFPLTNNEDIQAAGGEGAVAARVVGRFLPYRGRNDPDAAAAFFLRCAVFLGQTTFRSSTLPEPPDLWTVTSMSQENIVWMDTVLVNQSEYVTVADPLYTNTVHLSCCNWMHVDTSAKRRLAEDAVLCFTMQAAPTGALVPTTFSVQGYLRVLLLHATR